MADSATIDRIQEARQKARKTIPEAQQLKDDLASGQIRDFRVSAPPKTNEDERPEGDLEDSKNQRKIMEPDFKEIKLSWGKVTLHKLSARNMVKFHGFALEAVTTSAQVPQNGMELIGLMTLNATLAENDSLATKLCFYAACATAPPGKLDMQQAIEIGKEIFNNSKIEDYLALYAVLAELTDFDRVLKAYVLKKDQPAMAKQA